MGIKAFFDLLDATPFMPFTVELLNGRRVLVTHPENVHIIPNRQKVWDIIVVNAAQDDWALFYPASICGFRKRPRRNGRAAR